jgi:hypothetical protein
VVSWRTDRDTDADSFLVYAAASDATDADVLGWDEPKGRDRRLRNAAAARSVRILTFAEHAWSYGRTTVRVPG